MPKVSVIIPVYGVEKYIERCARSLFEQTLDDIEFIFIDDCSQDNSVKKIELTLNNYSARKAFTRIIRMPTNSGLAVVRRQGVIAATGDFIIHCDSDDWVAPDMYERMYNYAIENDCDMVWCDYFRTDGMKHRVVKQDCEATKENLIKCFLGSRLIASVCNRLYKRRLQICDDFEFPVSNMTEDFVITLQLVLKANKIGYLPEPFYYYFQNSESICLTPNGDKILKNFEGQLANGKIIFSKIEQAGLAQLCKKEIECKKCTDKDFLRPLLDQEKYRQLWLSTYPEVNKAFLFNSLVPVTSKVRAFFVLFRIYPLYNILLKLIR